MVLISVPLKRGKISRKSAVLLQQFEGEPSLRWDSAV